MAICYDIISTNKFATWRSNHNSHRVCLPVIYTNKKTKFQANNAGNRIWCNIEFHFLSCK